MAVVSYEPKEGTGWVEGSSLFEDVRRWQAPIDGETWLRVTVTGPNGLFVVARVCGNELAPPRLEDIGRVERDFGARGWSILGVVPAAPPASGQVLLARAAEDH